MTLRRLLLLVRYNPDDTLTRAIEADEAHEKHKALQARLRERRDHYRAQRRTA